MGKLVAGGQAKVKVLRTNDSWFGVTYREDRPHVVESIRQFITRGDYPQKLQYIPLSKNLRRVRKCNVTK